jgi:hypothetical protein
MLGYPQLKVFIQAGNMRNATNREIATKNMLKNIYMKELRWFILGVFVTQEFHCSKLAEANEPKYKLLLNPMRQASESSNLQNILVTWNRLGQKCRGLFDDVG